MILIAKNSATVEHRYHSIVQRSRWHVETETVVRQTWADRFSILSPWFADILNVVKRDCKSEHLRLDPIFVRQHFGGMPVQRITLEDMRAVYLQQILSGHEKLAEFVANRWLFKHMDLYRFFEESLQKISPDFDKIQELSSEQADELIHQACEKFGTEKVFCFVAINDVVVPKPSFDRLQRQALDCLAQRQSEVVPEEEGIELRWRKEMNLLKERHEKKIAELTKKHQQEIQRLQKELAQLTSELNAARAAVPGARR
jgi:hypothetical protein